MRNMLTHDDFLLSYSTNHIFPGKSVENKMLYVMLKHFHLLLQNYDCHFYIKILLCFLHAVIANICTSFKVYDFMTMSHYQPTQSLSPISCAIGFHLLLHVSAVIVHVKSNLRMQSTKIWR